MAKNHYTTKRNRRPQAHHGHRRNRLRPKIEAELAALAQKKDEDIDTSDIPEVTDWSKAEVGKFYRG